MIGFARPVFQLKIWLWYPEKHHSSALYQQAYSHLWGDHCFSTSTGCRDQRSL